MTAHTLEVPAEHLEEFRKAATGELESLTDLMHSEAYKLYSEAAVDRRAVRAAGIRNTGELAVQSLDLALQVNGNSESARVEARSETLAHALQEMASAEAEALTQVLGEGPLDTEALTERLASLDWAATNAARFHEIANREREAVAA